jgi:acylphosphatase
MPNGHVEVCAEGSRQDLEEFLRKLYEGPSGAYVRDITYEYLPPTGEDYSFRVTF